MNLLSRSFLRHVCLGLLALTCLAGAAQAANKSSGEKSGHRLALVIGNDSYEHVTGLDNARADARAIAKALEQVGFKVTLRLNANEKAMKEAVRNFKGQVAGGDDAVFYFSGHGVQLGAANYLLPTDINGESEEQVKDEALPLQRVLDDLAEQKAGFSLAIVDACRNNPFKGAGRKSIGGRGLAPTNAATGQMVLYSAGTGQEALDRLSKNDSNPNGLFTRVLLKEMEKPDVPVDRLLRSVRDEVVRLAQSVGHEQVPALYDQALGDFYFRWTGQGTQVASLRPEPTQPQRSAAQLEEDTWQAAVEANSEAGYEEYLKEYGKGKHAGQAKIALAKLKKEAQAATAAEASAPATSRDDADSALWKAVETGNNREDYEAYLNQYPKGKYIALAKSRLKKLQVEATSTRPVRPFKDCPDCPEMVTIPAGSFEMGESSNLHHVAIRAFAIGKTEVTQGQWQSVMGSNPSNFKNCGADCPVENVSWIDAQDFIQKLNEKTGKKYRLPSEAEWEYACGAGSKQEYCGGDNLDAVGWYGAYATPVGNSGKNTNPVGRKQANAWGLYDMSGNVWEWTEDCWHDNYSGAPTDGSAWTSGKCQLRVLRGGSWGYAPLSARAAERLRNTPGDRGNINGFRLARMLP